MSDLVVTVPLTFTGPKRSGSLMSYNTLSCEGNTLQREELAWSDPNTGVVCYRTEG